jgi:hypothetical protein
MTLEEFAAKHDLNIMVRYIGRTFGPWAAGISSTALYCQGPDPETALESFKSKIRRAGFIDVNRLSNKRERIKVPKDLT